MVIIYNSIWIHAISIKYTILIIVMMVFIIIYIYISLILHNKTGLSENNYYSSNNHNFNVFRIYNYAGYLNTFTVAYNSVFHACAYVQTTQIGEQ